MNHIQKTPRLVLLVALLFACSSAGAWQLPYSLTPSSALAAQLTGAGCRVSGCRKCFPGDMSKCYQCEKDYLISADGNECTFAKCELSVINCYACDPIKKNYCVECADGTEPISGVCQCKMANCKSCKSTERDMCLVCQEGFYLGEDQSTCISGPCSDKMTNCKVCVNGNMNMCRACEDGSAPSSSGKCHCTLDHCLSCEDRNGDKCEKCLPGYYLTSSFLFGQKCNKGDCADSVQYCSACSTKKNTKCEICEDGSAPVKGVCKCYASNCLECDPIIASQCSACERGYTLFAKYCMRSGCDVAFPNCNFCDKDPTQCSQCSTGYVLDSSVCVCSTAPNCLQCSPSNNQECAPNMCKDGYTYANGKCFPPCAVQDCAKCVDGDTEDCASCHSGYTLYTPQSQTRKKCILSGACLPTVSSTCAGCTDGKPFECNRCDNNLVLVNNECAACQAERCTTCAAGKVDRCALCSGTNVLVDDGVCVPCQAENCLKCVPGMPSQCDASSCEHGYGYDSVTKMCLPPCKSVNCLACAPESTDGRVCAQCTPGFNLLHEGSLTTCLPKGACSIDVTYCNLCEGDDPQKCLKCSSEFVLVKGKCEVCKAEACTRCATGNPTQCTEGACHEGYSLKNGVCKLPCRVDKCAQCMLHNDAVCILCDSPYELYNQDGWSLCRKSSAVLVGRGGAALVWLLAIMTTLAVVVV